MDKSVIKLSLLKKRRIVNACWEWTGCMRGKGKFAQYGRVTIKNRKYDVHRLSAYLWLGFDLSSKSLICHHCDNSKCFNPAHLYIGDHRTNTRDSIDRGRYVYMRGEKHGFSKLTDVDVFRIIELRKEGLSYKEIAKALNNKVSVFPIFDICKNDAWKHLKQVSVPKMIEERP